MLCIFNKLIMCTTAPVLIKYYIVIVAIVGRDPIGSLNSGPRMGPDSILVSSGTYQERVRRRERRVGGTAV